MTIFEALNTLNSYPIPATSINVILLDRDLVGATEYTKVIGLTQNYKLAIADLYFWLHGSPSIVEQQVGINQAVNIKENFLSIANKIYAEFEDPKFSGKLLGYKGENWNA